MKQGARDDVWLSPEDWCERWWCPADLLVTALAVKRLVAHDEFFRRQDMKRVREAIAMSEFAALRPCDRDWELRPVSEREQFPDFLLRNNSEVRQFEVVEADRDGRRRGDEYTAAAERAAKGQPPQLEHYDPQEEAQAAMPAIARRIGEKANKFYSPAPHLLVYVNFSAGEPTQREAAELAQQWGNRFASAWLIWQGTAFRLWPNPAKIRNRS